MTLHACNLRCHGMPRAGQFPWHAPQLHPSAHLPAGPCLQSLLCNEHLAELAGLGRLEQLSLRGCSRLTGAGLAQLSCLRRSLTMLNLSNCTGLTGGPGVLGMAGAFGFGIKV